MLERTTSIGRRRVLTGLLVVAAIVIVAIPVVGRIVQHPRSCTVCHFMEPYYKQWQTSKHKDVTCVKCHPYGAAFLTVALIKYTTNTYNPRPHSFVEDSACMQKGCHEGRLTQSKTKFMRDITFDHNQHIGKTLRGVKMHCTSCHSQIVQGEHMTVTKDACVLCHFMGAKESQAVTGCPSCHGVPSRTVEHGGFIFNHESYLKIGVECDQCHLKITEGNGAVPDSACNSCHVTRIEEKGEPIKLHKIHVEGRGFECDKCHEQMKHGEFKMINALEITCEKCHSSLHQFQKEMYMGTGSKGVNDLPSRMFAAQVSCDGCHIQQVFAHEAGMEVAEEKSLEPSRKACVTCHGAGYDLMLDDWIAINKGMMAAVSPVIESAKSVLKSSMKTPDDFPDAQILVLDAEFNYRFVKFGRGAHNIEYSMRTLSSAWDQADMAMKILNPAFAAAQRPDVFGKPGAYCTIMCHTRIGFKDQVYFDEMKLDFPHATHVNKVGVACTTCHSPEKHKMRIISPEGCMSCHHEAQDVSCETCHPNQVALYSGDWKESPTPIEPDTMKLAEIDCKSCHDLTVKGKTLENVELMCVSCHDADGKKWLTDQYNDLQKRIASLTALLVTARQKIDAAPWPGQKLDAARKILDSVEKDLAWLEKARGTHNYKMAVKIIEADQKRVQDAMNGKTQ